MKKRMLRDIEVSAIGMGLRKLNYFRFHNYHTLNLRLVPTPKSYSVTLNRISVF